MINVNQITAQMARMPDAALQHYAQMNKNDPYIMSLALSESNRRKEIRGSADMSAQPQPKVVDQSIAEMGQQPQPQQMPQGQAQPMPEHVGIGQLPAPNIQGMAEGGVVGYSGEAESLVRSTNGGKTWSLDVPDTIRDPSVPYYKPIKNPLYDILGDKQFTSRGEAVAAYDKARNPASDDGTTPSILNTIQQTQNTPKGNFYGDRKVVQAAINEIPDPAERQRAQQAFDGQSQENPGQNLPPKPAGSEYGGQQTPPAPTSTAPTPLAPAPGLPSLAEMAAQRNKILADQKLETPSEIDAGIASLQRAKEGLNKEQSEQFESDIAKRGTAFADQEKRLKARETQLGKDTEENKWTSLLEAGLAMMSGTSQYAAANIGAGAGVGVKAYKEGLKDLAKVRDKLDDSFGRIEEYRRTEGMMTDKERRALMADAKKPAIEAQQMGLNFLTKKWELGEAQASELMKAWTQTRIAQFEQGSANKRTEMTVNALPAEARLAMSLGDGKTDQEKFASGSKIITEAAADKSGMAAVKLLTEANAKREAAGQPPITMLDLLNSAKEYSALMYPKTTDAVPKNATVLRQ